MSSEFSSSLIAQGNIDRFRQPLDHPCMLGTASRIDEMNRLAESSPGFVWRFKSNEKEKPTFSFWELFAAL